MTVEMLRQWIRDWRIEKKGFMLGPVTGQQLLEDIDNNSRPFTYLACPYTHPDPAVKAWRFKMANKGAAFLQNRGKFVFSPISSSHPIAEDGGLPTTWEYWKAFDYAFLRHCKEIFVLTLDGWTNSTGVRAELEIAREMGIPEFILDPEQLPDFSPGPAGDSSVRESCCRWSYSDTSELFVSQCGYNYSRERVDSTGCPRVYEYCPGCGRPIVL